MSVSPSPADPRRALLDASLALLADQGLEGFSMREVARRAGVSHQAPYHHFPDRESILAEIVAEGFERLRDDTLAALASEQEPGKRFTATGKAYLRFALNNPAHFKLMFRSELVREDKHEQAQACAQGAYDVLVTVAREVAALSGRDEHLVVLTGWSMVHGLATLILEGKLEKALPDASAREGAAHQAIELLETLWRR
jgi:AcrR family transcriptional regulator